MKMIPTPCTHLRLSDNGGPVTELELFRCDTDGALIFQHPDLIRVHAGHHFKTPVFLQVGEQKDVIELWQMLKSQEQVRTQTVIT